jgi:hypothetical protein
MWQRDLRKGLITTLHYDAWISSWFSSDHPLSSILISLCCHEAVSPAPCGVRLRQKGRFLISKPFLFDSVGAAQLVALRGAFGLRYVAPFATRNHVPALQSLLRHDYRSIPSRNQ